MLISAYLLALVANSVTSVYTELRPPDWAGHRVFYNSDPHKTLLEIDPHHGWRAALVPSYEKLRRVPKEFRSTAMERHLQILTRSIFEGDLPLPIPKAQDIYFCPNSVDIDPCSCFVNGTINCSPASTMREIHDIFNTATFPMTNLNRFIYDPPEALYPLDTVLLNHTFGPVSFQSVAIIGSAIRQVEPCAFCGSEGTLEYVVMLTNKLEEFKMVSGFSVLSAIDLTSNSLHIFSVGWQPTLSLLYLDNNKYGTTMSAETFYLLPKLEVLDMAVNSLVVLPDHSYKFQNITFLYLDNNDITTISPLAFSAATPQFLDLTDNNLTSFSEEVFKPILDNIIQLQIGAIIVIGNPLACDSLAWTAMNPEYKQCLCVPAECIIYGATCPPLSNVLRL